ncbi:MAG: AraC family transcriptional regulator [Enterobacteriaceae bacterium]
MSDKPPLTIPFLEQLPSPVYFRYDEFGADSHSSAHQHAWGQLNYVAHGVMQLEIAGQRFLSPPQYAVWIPPWQWHSCYNPQAIIYRSVYLSLPLSERLPATPCCLSIGAILKTILADFGARAISIPQTEADMRLSQVVIDQLELAPVLNDYLPFSHTADIEKITHQLQENPADNRSLAEWARQVHSTERTLARHFQRELGMTFGEWRQRLRLLRAIDSLEQGVSIQQIAFDLGYNHASAFISMFRRLTGTTPEQYRITKIQTQQV